MGEPHPMVEDMAKRTAKASSKALGSYDMERYSSADTAKRATDSSHDRNGYRPIMNSKTGKPYTISKG